MKFELTGPVVSEIIKNVDGRLTDGCKCNLILLVPNLHPGDCPHWVHPVFTVSKPTSRGLSTWGIGCL